MRGSRTREKSAAPAPPVALRRRRPRAFEVWKALAARLTVELEIDPTAGREVL